MTTTATTILTLGYTAPDAKERLEALMSDPMAVLVDIRQRAGARGRPLWNKGRLQARYGARYIHIRSLGNKNYRLVDRHKGIELNNPDEGLEQLSKLVQAGYTPILLCGCKDYETCHRKVVYEAFKKEGN